MTSSSTFRRVVTSAIAVAATAVVSLGGSTEAWGKPTSNWEVTDRTVDSKRTSNWEVTNQTNIKTSNWELKSTSNWE
jgi:hypothetical protein